ncbi:hypothetical protein QC761_0063000 [Podospora bellae-mahoneyi]|uniref:Uncharacterized protein n=1 Tax=Podospora bellae-mahoneyi TaxID=2093777 RepID=A0ABR0FG88_9PEZI|nr:hypothetical protein QC761_0063000 [Podospora bellae-mahoneyi]
MADMNVIHTYLAVTTDVPDQCQEMASKDEEGIARLLSSRQPPPTYLIKHINALETLALLDVLSRSKHFLHLHIAQDGQPTGRNRGSPFLPPPPQNNPLPRSNPDDWPLWNIDLRMLALDVNLTDYLSGNDPDKGGDGQPVGRTQVTVRAWRDWARGGGARGSPGEGTALPGSVRLP